MSASGPESLMSWLEETAAMVAALTGMKKQLMDAGWSERGAEQIVIATMGKR